MSATANGGSFAGRIAFITGAGSGIGRATFESFGRLDAAFNNAAIEQPVKAAADITENEWERSSRSTCAASSSA